MINVKDQVYTSLETVCPHATDSYPQNWATLPAVMYVEEENNVYEFTHQEEKSYIRYKIDIWDNKSTSQTALEVDKAISKLGLKRTTCQDVPDPSGLKHKVMRYEGVIDVYTEQVYQY